MGHTVVIAEKPSVGRDIARVLGCKTNGRGCLMGEEYIVTWAVGHLVTLVEPDELDEKYKHWRFDTLPILPDDIPLKVIHSSRDQFQVVRDLINAPDTDRLICATDAGREGELIFRYIYQKANCRKPFDRLWISSMTDEAIQEGFRSIKSGSAYDGLYRSALCRSQADWLVGMNASRAFTLRYDALLSVGRVQTPTLAILVKRRKEIEDFKPEEYATVTANFGDYKGMWFSEALNPNTHIPKVQTAKEIAAQIQGQTATVLSAETTRGRELPPQLYDLTSLQRDANRLLGFTADKTLKLAQSLYETHKALTYPRTDSRYLPPDMIPRVVQTMKMLPDNYQKLIAGALPGGHLPVSKRTIDETKVTDHHAILPTPRRIRLDTLSPDERQLYDMVTRRMLSAFYPACEFDATKVITGVGEHRFRTNGRVVIQNGWHDIPPLENPPPTSRSRKKPADAEEDTVLPPLAAGDVRTVSGSEVKSDKTKPPAQHNDASLLATMENAGRESTDEEIARQMKGRGIGTPATRANIIERLIKVGYAIRKGKTILATDKGVQLIAIVPQELSSPEMTGRWELALDRITDGEQDADKFMDSIRKFSTFLVNYARNNRADIEFPDDGRRKQRAHALVLRGDPVEGCHCPVCHKGQVLENPRSFFCSRFAEGCHFTLWKDCLEQGGGPTLTAKLLQLLLDKTQLQGSSGIITLQNDTIAFFPNGATTASVYRPITYEKRRSVKRG